MKKRPPPPVNYIRSFEAAARHLSFTRAADELGYTQAAISTHVRGLEKYLGRTLFLRRARSLRLTETGEALLPTLRQALQQIDSATDAIATGAREQSVALSCPISLAETWLPDRLARFWQTHKQVEVLIHGTVWERGEEGLADIVISIHRDDEVPPDCRVLIAQELVLVCPPQMADGLRTPADVLRAPQIQVSGRQEYFAIFAAQHGLSPPGAAGSVLRTNGSNISLAMAARGLGCTIALSTLAQPYLDSGRLVAPFAGTPLPSPWSYYIATPPGRMSGAARALLACLEG